MNDDKFENPTLEDKSKVFELSNGPRFLARTSDSSRHSVGAGCPSWRPTSLPEDGLFTRLIGNHHISTYLQGGYYGTEMDSLYACCQRIRPCFLLTQRRAPNAVEVGDHNRKGCS